MAYPNLLRFNERARSKKNFMVVICCNAEYLSFLKEAALCNVYSHGILLALISCLVERDEMCQRSAKTFGF